MYEREVLTVNTLFNSEVVLRESCGRLELFIHKITSEVDVVDREKVSDY
jgi:hypothetical protein